MATVEDRIRRQAAAARERHFERYGDQHAEWKERMSQDPVWARFFRSES